MNAFLEAHGWSLKEPVAQDGSARAYFRVEKNGKTAIFLETYGDTPGHRVSDFIRIGGWLRDIGLNAPEIYEADQENGLLILEDFGSLSFGDALRSGHDPEALYRLASQALDVMGAHSCLSGLDVYSGSYIDQGHPRVIDWFVPVIHRQKNPSGLKDAYLSVWEAIQSNLDSCPDGFIHGDYHVENLMFLPGEEGLKKCGILDFQGAVKGPLPYDLGNLLEDARMDVPENIRTALLAQHDENFRAWYRVLTTQFHCRLMGQFIKMAHVDGKTVYLNYLPRVSAYLEKALKDPLLKPLAQFFEDLEVDFAASHDINMERIQDYVSADAC